MIAWLVFITKFADVSVAEKSISNQAEIQSADTLNRTMANAPED